MAHRTEEEFARLREQMVQTQLEARNINDEAVLAAMRKIPRHIFVPKDQLAHAYEDQPIPIASGSTISQPYIIGYMLEALRLTSHDTVLEVGTGSGYQSALLSEIAGKVYSIDINDQLVGLATRRIAELGYRNFFPRVGNGYEGWDRRAPFDAIIVSAACEGVPRELVRQLAPYGRMIFPLEGDPQFLVLLERTDSELLSHELCPVRFVSMLPSKRSGHN
ncbi:MAG: protein-L-isoaspartate(D-aspartate) O-methyltransferase [Proteobacteria bacterium]|nr:protein-L-isoaspartate(D-aspartate) O-methyltransferase [Pseudomonadota bacterium]